MTHFKKGEWAQKRSHLSCFFGFHALWKDKEPINGVQWALCARCGARFSERLKRGKATWERR